jgi:hypothetical protein
VHFLFLLFKIYLVLTAVSSLLVLWVGFSRYRSFNKMHERGEI